VTYKIHAEKIYTVLGLEFGADAGKMAIIVHALYGLKSAGASFQRHLADCMQTLGYNLEWLTRTCGSSQW
jgi:hypothetical protein